MYIYKPPLNDAVKQNKRRTRRKEKLGKQSRDEEQKREFTMRCCERCQDRQQRGKIAEENRVWKNVTSGRSDLARPGL